MTLKTLICTVCFLSISVFALDIASFEDEAWRSRIASETVDIQIVQEHASDGKAAAKMFFKGSPKPSSPGFTVSISPEELKENNILSFSAWHEADEALVLTLRIDFYEGEITFDNFAMPPKTLAPIEVPLAFRDSEGNVIAPKRLFFYRRRPATDSTIWFDNFKLAYKKTLQTPITYIPPKSKRTPTEEEKAFGAQLFSRTWMEHIFRNVKPLPSDTANPILKVAACPGESEPVMLSIHALKDVANATLSVPTPLKSADGNEISPKSFTVQYLAYLDKRTTYAASTFYKRIPMVLEKRASIAVKANDSQSIWVDVAVPQDAKPGLYKGNLLLTLDGKSKSIPYELTVRPFVAPEATDMFFGEYLTIPRGDVDTFAKQCAQYEHDMAFMRKLNMTTVGLCIGPDISKCVYKDGKVTIQFKQEELFVFFMDLYVKYHYPCPVIFLRDPGDQFAQAQGFAEFSPEYKACYHAFWKAMQAECKARNWPELIVQPEDECGWRPVAIQKRNVQLLKYLKELPGMRTEVDGPADSYFYNQAGPHADVWNFNGCVAPPAKMKELAAEGRLVTLYNNDVECYRSVTSRYAAGFFMARSGANGVLNWAMRSYSGSAFSDFDTSRLGDTTNYFPGDGVHSDGPGIGMLAFREGIDDYRYIRYLQELIKQHPGPKADYAQKVLDEILGSIHYFTQLRDAASFQSLPLGPDGNHQVTDVLNLKTGWRLEDYDRAREIIAAQIETLLDVKNTRDNAQPPALALTVADATSSTDGALAVKRVPYNVTIARYPKPPILDGKLDDDCWKTAGNMKDFSINVGGKPLAQTQAWMATDGESLFIAAECEEPYMGNVTANIRRMNGPVYNDDSLEIFFDPTMEMAGYYHLAVNVLGFMYFGGTLGSWKPNAKAATSRESDRWTMELSIPLKDLKLKGSSFGFNICRERRPKEVFELSCWSPTGGAFGQPSRFGTASMGTAWIRKIDVESAAVGNGSIIVSLITDKAPQGGLVAEVSCKLLDGKKVCHEKRVSQKWLSNHSQNLLFPLQLTQGGELEVMVTIKNAAGELLEKQVVRREVKSPITISVVSPFIEENWRSLLTLDYRPFEGEKLELQVWASSNPEDITTLSIGENRCFAVTLNRGAFAPLDGLHAQLVDINSKRIIGTSENTLLAK